VGAGYWGPNLTRNIAELADAELIGIADLDESQRDRARRRYPASIVTSDFNDFFDNYVDAVVIATPPATHFAIASAFLERGVHCLVEKPLAGTIEESRALLSIAAINKAVLMVGHTFEYNPAVREIRRLIDSGELGEIFYIDAVRTNLGIFQMRTNVMWDLAPHDISIANYLLDAKPVSVGAQAGSFIMRDVGINDLAYLHMEYPGGQLANIRVSWLDPNKTRRTTVVGSKKMLIYDDVANLEKIRIYDKGLTDPPFVDSYGELQCSYRYGNVTIPHLSWEEPLRLECEDFITSILGGTVPQADGESGLRVVQALAAADRSLELGRVVELSELDSKVLATEAFNSSEVSTGQQTITTS